MTRIAIVKREDCHPEKCGHVCAKYCPVNRMGQECIVIASSARIDEALCTGCGICPKRCPFEAIKIINLPEELDKEPIHRYGQNEFALYSLPTPIFGKVVGVIGKNGIGKSTAIKILAGILKPNFGDWKSEGYDYQKLIDYFKGTEAQQFFEKVKSGKIKISYKPQQVDLIPKTTEGRVIDLLKKVDEKDMLNEIAEKLELTKILDHSIKDISGGELQRVAIAATVLKKANLYIFDEPTSYLDIKQRLKTSKFIRELANEQTAVMVIEHDLVILDYIADLVNIIYGKEECYGIVSQLKSTKEGINIFLSGYLREENIRFRDSQIKFDVSPTGRTASKEELTSWTGIQKKLGKFSLSAEQGVIHKKEVIGIVGENGIGKTTFVKILAGVIEKDKGSVETEVKVSYKPQYLVSSEQMVADILKDAAAKYSVQLIKPLELDRLLTKKLNQLSGGQLQRVAIAECLSKDAHLYLMDEPSAYLDVEQRLLISKIIKDFMINKGSSCLIVDHDLLFIDYLSDKLMVFGGEPAVHGDAKGPFAMQEGMNMFLQDINITFRRDPESHRPRANKPDSQMDRKQKSENKLYYV